MLKDGAISLTFRSTKNRKKVLNPALKTPVFGLKTVCRSLVPPKNPLKSSRKRAKTRDRSPVGPENGLILGAGAKTRVWRVLNQSLTQKSVCHKSATKLITPIFFAR